MIIYKVINKLNGKIYIGQTTQTLKERWRQHCHRSPAQKHRSPLYSAVQLYGEENFSIEQIDQAVTRDELNVMETTYIKAFRCLSPNGYNLELGGNSNEVHPETRAKISESMRRKPREQLFGGRRQVGAPRGRPVSKERRARISETMRGQPQPWKYKAVQVVETGQIFPSVNAAAKALGVNRVTISSLLKSGKAGRLGLRFKFI